MTIKNNVGHNIVLVGFMGVGKGRTARVLSKVSSMYAVDCDDLIESLENMKIKKIFAKYGENYFRELEKRTATWLEQNITSTVISTGGGFINIPNLKKIGMVTYLHNDFSTIIDSILSHTNAKKKIKKRPLLGNLDKAKKLYDTRIPLYRNRADCIIEVKGKSIKDVAEEIFVEYKNFYGL